jgi:hypothetical protein
MHYSCLRRTNFLSLSNYARYSDGDIFHIADEENVDDTTNDIRLELNNITLELSQDDITDVYEAGGDD